MYVVCCCCEDRFLTQEKERVVCIFGFTIANLISGYRRATTESCADFRGKNRTNKHHFEYATLIKYCDSINSIISILYVLWFPKIFIYTSFGVLYISPKYNTIYIHILFCKAESKLTNQYVQMKRINNS